MSPLAFAGTLEIGLVYAFVAAGIYLSFYVLEFPDLTVDGSFPLGGAVSAVLIVGGANPWLSLLAAFAAGGVAGLATAILSLRFKLLPILASILTMTALYSINLRVMGMPNIALVGVGTVFNTAGWTLFGIWAIPLLLGLMAAVCLGLVGLFLLTSYGLSLRATGINPRMAEAQGISVNSRIYVGLAISNAMVALGGALFAQSAGFCDVNNGVGTLVAGLASVVVGSAFFKTRNIFMILVGMATGSILYRLFVQLALSADSIGLQPSDLSLVSAVLVAVAMILPKMRLMKRRVS